MSKNACASKLKLAVVSVNSRSTVPATVSEPVTETFDASPTWVTISLTKDARS